MAITIGVPSSMTDDELTRKLGGAASDVLDDLALEDKRVVFAEVRKLRLKWPRLTIDNALAVLAVAGCQVSRRYC